MRILIISPYPPPIGGNTVHVKRLLALLKEANHEAKVLDYSSITNDPIDSVITLPSQTALKATKLVAVARQLSSDTIIHFHVSALGRFKLIAPFLMFLFGRHSKVLTIHSGSFIAKTKGVVWHFYLKWLLKHFQQVITVSIEQAKYLAELGVPESKLTTIPAYLPEIVNDDFVPNSIKQIPHNKIIVLTSGYLTPIYNYDSLIDCIGSLENSNYFFIFAFYNEVAQNYEHHIYTRLSTYKNVLILRDQPPEVFVSVLTQCHIYVRTTLTDGDAVAIREAIQYRKVVFATACVQRPPGCYLFSDTQTLLKLLTDYSNNKLRPFSEDIITSSFFEKILQVYYTASRLKQ